MEPLVSVDGDVFVEAVKLAEDGSGDVVVRLYEPQGARTTAERDAPLRDDRRAARSTCSNGRSSQGAWDGHRLAVRPFQIVTLRFAR